ncbi:uncharacterized protein [Argopecten irradians]|uniref:uncharacterized protein n=1 Tax=Argopecten irradians TaxID=31199 RepID=UPI00371743F9
MELQATIKNKSIAEFRLQADRSIARLDHDFQHPSFILGTLIRSRVRFVHVLSEIRLEADYWQNLPVLLSKYNLLTQFMHDNLVVLTRRSHFTMDASFIEMDKAFEVVALLEKVDIYNNLDCYMTISDNETSIRSTYSYAMFQNINTINAHITVLSLRGATVLTNTEWNFLKSLTLTSRFLPDQDFINIHRLHSRNSSLCDDTNDKLKTIIDHVLMTSKRLLSSLNNRIHARSSDAVQEIGIYTMLLLLCVILFGIVCVLHHGIINRLLTFEDIEDTISKQLSEEQDRVTSILHDAIPLEYIEAVNGINIVNNGDRTKPAGNIKKSKIRRLKSSIESLTKSSRSASVEPETYPLPVEDTVIPANLPLLKLSKPDVMYGVFDSATLFMCDFIHLNDLVALYEPDQLVNLVTCLIQILEARTKLYNVHVLCKNINTFTVISGLQCQHALRHVTEIANMALDIRASCSDLEIDVLPDSKLRMRISIHTSDCVYKLTSHPEPRFHIYGDIVDITMELQKNCTANRIHISDEVGTILRKEHQYQIERKGMILCTNGRYLSTQWLLGRRVSVCNPNHEVRGKTFLPIQLAEKPIYIFDKEKVKYVSPYWMSSSNQFNESISMSETSYSDSDFSFNDR